jgi:hypothetical protein
MAAVFDTLLSKFWSRARIGRGVLNGHSVTLRCNLHLDLRSSWKCMKSLPAGSSVVALKATQQ